jgi:hypothetical protein
VKTASDFSSNGTYIEPSRMKQGRILARIGEMSNAHTIFVEEPEGTENIRKT